MQVLHNLLDKEVGKLDDQGCLEIKVQTESGSRLWVCSNHPFQHNTTVHSAEQQANLFGEETMQHLKLKNFC